jgi:hypothetical protein
VDDAAGDDRGVVVSVQVRAPTRAWVAVASLVFTGPQPHPAPASQSDEDTVCTLTRADDAQSRFLAMSAATSMKEQPMLPTDAVGGGEQGALVDQVDVAEPVVGSHPMSGAKGRKARLLVMGSYTHRSDRRSDLRRPLISRRLRTTSPFRDVWGLYRSRRPAAAMLPLRDMNGER